MVFHKNIHRRIGKRFLKKVWKCNEFVIFHLRMVLYSNVDLRRYGSIFCLLGYFICIYFPMSHLIFLTKRNDILDLCGDEENLCFLEHLFLTFHHIFVLRLSDISPDRDQYNHLYVPAVHTFTDKQQMSMYSACMHVIDFIDRYTHMRDHFHLFNSHEKISFDNFVELAQSRIPHFDAFRFGLLIIENNPTDILLLDARFIDDFMSTQAYHDYKKSKLQEHREKTSLI